MTTSRVVYRRSAYIKTKLSIMHTVSSITISTSSQQRRRAAETHAPLCQILVPSLCPHKHKWCRYLLRGTRMGCKRNISSLSRPMRAIIRRITQIGQCRRGGKVSVDARMRDGRSKLANHGVKRQLLSPRVSHPSHPPTTPTLRPSTIILFIFFHLRCPNS
jgi:hypothetical protein